jgi:disulfide bond formation protein DsbB
VGAIAVGLLWEYRVQQIAFFKKNKFLVIGILAGIAGALIIFSKPLGINHYGNVLSEHFKEAPFFKRMGWRFKEWGELFINAPSNKVIDRLAGEAGRIAYEVVGFIIFCWFVYKVYFRKNSIPFFIKAYILFYCIIMFNWPFNDPRFWVPIMPIIAAVVLQALFADDNKVVKIISIASLVVYIALGAFASGYMVYTSLNKKAFARTQAKGAYRSEYEIHFYGKPLSDTVTTVDKDVIDLLKRYD